MKAEDRLSRTSFKTPRSREFSKNTGPTRLIVSFVSSTILSAHICWHNTFCATVIFRSSIAPCCSRLSAEFLFDFLDELDAFNVTYSLNKGTLLGAVRDGFIIPWDTADLDIFLDPRNPGAIESAEFAFMEKHGVTKTNMFQNGCLLDTFHVYLKRWQKRYGRVSDLFCFVAGLVFDTYEPYKENYTLVNARPRTHASFRGDLNVMTVPFGTMAGKNAPQRMVTISRDFDEILSSLYGDDWRIPVWTFTVNHTGYSPNSSYLSVIQKLN